MFYQECEELANEQPDLEETIEKVDKILHSINPSGIIKIDLISDSINEKSSVVSGIIQQLCEKGLLYQKEYVKCLKCGNLITNEYIKSKNNEEPFKCTRCQGDITLNHNLVKEFKLNSPKTHKTIKTNDNPKNSSKELYQEIPSKMLTDPFKNTPLLQYYSKNPDWISSKPFEDKKVFFVLHFLKDLIPFVKACEKLGLNLKNSYFFYKEYPYPQRDAVKNWLEEQNAIVKPRSEIKNIIKQLSESPSSRIGNILIIEDGGFFVPLIHEEFPSLIDHVIGAVEQTTRGIMNAEDIDELKFTVLSVATSELKGNFEPDYVAEAVTNNITNLLPHLSLRSKKVGLFGHGTIGQKINEWLHKKDSITTVYEPKAERRILVKNATLANSPAETAENKDFIIGSSGRQSVDSKVISYLSHGTYLVSASSEQYEIDIDELKRQSRTEEEYQNDNGEIVGTTYKLPPNDRAIHALANGYPINFWGFDSMPDEASDLIMSLILLSAAELASGNYLDQIINAKGVKTYINSDAVNQIAEKHELAKKFMEFH